MLLHIHFWCDPSLLLLFGCDSDIITNVINPTVDATVTNDDTNIIFIWCICKTF